MAPSFSDSLARWRRNRDADKLRSSIRPNNSRPQAPSAKPVGDLGVARVTRDETVLELSERRIANARPRNPSVYYCTDGLPNLGQVVKRCDALLFYPGNSRQQAPC